MVHETFECKKEASDVVEGYYNDALETMLDVQSPHCWCVNSQKLRNYLFFFNF